MDGAIGYSVWDSNDCEVAGIFSLKQYCTIFRKYLNHIFAENTNFSKLEPIWQNEGIVAQGSSQYLKPSETFLSQNLLWADAIYRGLYSTKLWTKMV